MHDILDDLPYETSEERTYELASQGKRFANYLIDSIGYLFFSALIGVFLGLASASTGNEDIFEETDSIESAIFEWVLGIFIITFYYFLQEHFLKGKTLGKFFTKTRAVTVTNERMDFGTTLKRTLCRLIPFEAFSFLSDKPRGWHDSISDTKVIMDDDWQETKNNKYV